MSAARQELNRDLLEPLKSAGLETILFSGTDIATELDAKRSIDQTAAAGT